MCNQGYSSSLAAATLRDLGLSRATDLVGGFQAFNRFLRHLSDRSDGELRFSSPRSWLSSHPRQYLPVLIINGLAASFFMIGYLLFGVAMIRTATLPRLSASSLLWALPLTCSVSG